VRQAPAALTVIVPAYNEAASIEDTIRSLQNQTTPPAEIIVVDDCSTDDTAERATRMGVTVVQPPVNTGSKAGAQTYALAFVRTPLTMAVDGDTIVAPDAVEKVVAALDDEKVAAACGFVIPRHVKSVWERGRYVEYMFAFSFYKQVQDFYRRPLISSGCFSVYRTPLLRRMGGWAERTRAEDMDLTWTLYEQGWNVRFVPDAVCYPIEPHDLTFLRKQLKRWSHGFVQNLRLHGRGILRLRFLAAVAGAATFDAMLAPIGVFLLLPVLAVLVSPLFLLGYLLDAPMVLLPALVGARRRREVGKLLASFPAFVLLRLVNAWYMARAIVAELILRKPLLVYEKGH
jgi:biofilm PGA synthesis N-glycosyltransferase PgaC